MCVYIYTVMALPAFDSSFHPLSTVVQCIPGLQVLFSLPNATTLARPGQASRHICTPVVGSRSCLVFFLFPPSYYDWEEKKGKEEGTVNAGICPPRVHGHKPTLYFLPSYFFLFLPRSISVERNRRWSQLERVRA